MKRSLLWLAMLSASAAHADILINETDADTPSTDTAEFIELYDGGLGAQSLNGLSLVLFNGNGDASYKSISLNGFQTNADGYFVVCGDDSNVSNCDLDLSPDSNLVQNGADAVALFSRPASDFPNGTPVTTDGLIDAVVYDTNDSDDAGLLPLLNAGQPQLNEAMSGNKDHHSLQRCSGGARDTEGFVADLPTPGEANACGGSEPEPTLGACGDVATPISAIQGLITDIANDASPMNGQQVIVEAIVTTDLQGGTLANGEYSYQYSGFWLQQADNETDTDPMTSEGVFVYNYSENVSVGDRVRLQATVGEYNNVTQLSNISDIAVCSSGNALPAAIELTLPVADLAEFEAVEGMLVESDQSLLISDLFGTGYGFGNYGQFAVSSRLHFQGTEIALPGSAEALAAEPNRVLDTLLIDDGVSASYPEFIPFPDDSGFSADNPVRIGYSVPAFAGVMNAFRDNYTVIPAAITIDPTHPRTLVPQVSDQANLVVVGMNVLNFFNGDGMGGGFPTSRGAPSADALDMQTAKIVAALDAMNADVIGLMELENDGWDAESAIVELTEALNAVQAPGDEYSVINPGGNRIGTDEIAVGLIYRADRVTPVGAARVLDSSNSPLDENNIPLFDDTKNRPALIQTFNVDGQEITFAVNHLKSKGSACNEPDEGLDGQGSCNINRTRAAQALVEFLADDEQVMILGDLNAYSQEDPMQAFYSAGFTNLKYTDAATEERPYSYTFSGLLGSLDHALATDDLLAQVVSVDAWHINSVEDSLVDYLTEANGQPYRSVDSYAAPDAYRSSDHDPIVVGLMIEEPNVAPEQVADIPAIEVTRRNQNIAVDLSAYVTDADGDLLSYQAVTLPQGMTLSSMGVLSGVADRDLLNQLPVSATVEVSDGGESIQLVVDIRDERPAANFFNRVYEFFRSIFSWLFGR
ncbi:ExeM/NucH family extracellular endonuclease [Thalassolituus sp. UBA3500]|uniref:ExeM/NucH family extracellular endonuclease n=1 Tax=Thalassolituus sp. UBA3500 TaxID=1947664 RepID=UPI000C0F6D87|nr:ExeM/NucH family extracellular endonuclease [Thalassolituus sp. UBA3500]MBN59082.1 endonuclease/exonuclease/phosphatase [Oceanospirillaceae bacterium]|tara:strand:+ start:10513 stop:13287 length:2775 start_codon:yes stop_codon:yes gene_type:complete